MSSRPDDYPFLKQAFVQSDNRHNQTLSPNNTPSKMSSQSGLRSMLLTPPTPYMGEDELSEVDGTDKPLIKASALVSPKSQASHTTPESENKDSFHSFQSVNNIKHGDKNNEDDKSGMVESPKSDDDSPAAPIVDPVCAGEPDGGCTLSSGDHRKVVSHIFGRNKRCTHQIPEDCWIKYCRKHYQRQKYRCPKDWYETQLLLIDHQLDKMETWGGITSWTINIRKRERDIIDAENNHLAQHGQLPNELTRERFLLPFVGSGKNYADVRAVVDAVDQECDDFKAAHPGEIPSLPAFEFLPTIDERRNPRPKRGGSRRGTTHASRPAAPQTFKLESDPSTGKLIKIETSPTTATFPTTYASPAPPAKRPKIEKTDSSRATSTISAAAATPAHGNDSARVVTYPTIIKRKFEEFASKEGAQERHAHGDKRHRRTMSL
ncbi:MAG: hypothetical protein Q9174_006034 [Haloplaca sp. 1 TL-2023]